MKNVIKNPTKKQLRSLLAEAGKIRVDVSKRMLKKLKGKIK